MGRIQPDVLPRKFAIACATREPKLRPLPAPFRKCVSLAGLKMSSSSMGSSSNLH